MVLLFWNLHISMGAGPNHMTQGPIGSQWFVLCLLPPKPSVHNSHRWLQHALHTVSRLGIATVLEVTVAHLIALTNLIIPSPTQPSSTIPAPSQRTVLKLKRAPEEYPHGLKCLWLDLTWFQTQLLPQSPWLVVFFLLFHGMDSPWPSVPIQLKYSITTVL